MIYFTYSFNKHKIIDALLENNLIEGVIVSKLHIKESVETLNKKIKNFINLKAQVIYDHPIYMSDLLDFSNEKTIKNIKERSAEKLFLNIHQNINKYFINYKNEIEDIQEKWINYINDSKKQPESQKVLGVPNFINNEIQKKQPELISKIPIEKYDYISFGISPETLMSKEHLANKISLIKNMAAKVKINKCMFTVKTTKFDETLGKLARSGLVKIIKELKLLFSEVIIHHNAFMTLQANNQISIAYGYDKQTNSSSMDVMPFNNDETVFKRSKSPSYFSWISMANMKIKPTSISHELGEPLYAHKIHENFLKETNPYIDWTNGKLQYTSSFYDAISIRIIMNMSESDKKTKIQYAINEFTNISKTEQKNMFNTSPKNYEQMLS